MFSANVAQCRNCKEPIVRRVVRRPRPRAVWHHRRTNLKSCTNPSAQWRRGAWPVAAPGVAEGFDS